MEKWLKEGAEPLGVAAIDTSMRESTEAQRTDIEACGPQSTAPVADSFLLSMAAGRQTDH